jgi:hypothetical protein
MAQGNNFQAAISAVLADIRAAGGITSNAIPSRFAGDGTLSPYRGTNIFLLAFAGGKFGLSSVWGTANALRDATGRLVAKGQQSAARIIFAGMGEAPKKRDPLLAADPKEEKDEDGKKKLIRMYRTFAVFNASQLAGFDSKRKQLALARPSRESTKKKIEEALENRARDLPPGERALDQRLTDAVIDCSQAVVDWFHGIDASVSAGWFDGGVPDLLTIWGVTQHCVDTLELPGTFYAYGIPDLFDPDAVAQESTAQPATAPQISAETVSAADADIDLGW